MFSEDQNYSQATVTIYIFDQQEPVSKTLVLKATRKWKIMPHKQVRGSKWRMDAIHIARGNCGRERGLLELWEARKSGQQMPEWQAVLKVNTVVEGRFVKYH